VPIPLTGRDDAALVEAIRHAYAMGDAGTVQSAFAHVQYRHQDRIRGRVAMKLPSDRVDETVQDVFLDLFEAIVHRREIVNLTAWLNKVAANQVADYHRGRHARSLKGAVSLDDEIGAQLAPAADGGQGLAEVEAVIASVLGTLDPTHHEAVLLAVFHDRPAREVADATGETEANVYQIVRRFRIALRAALDGENGG
jgi:RNA polymerase sigma factor (sigma-70 family)